jgi:membrane protein YdbS with pleckstrin-like domain
MMNEQTDYQKLPAASIKAWRLEGGLWSLIVYLAPAYVLFTAWTGAEYSLWFIIAVVAVALLSTIVFVFVVPKIRWRQWQYKIDEHEIDLHHGIWFTHSTLVPVKRVQHVDTRQGPILRSYNLADVIISTAATTHKIPALSASKADEVRSEISTFARKAKDDV